MYKSIYITVSKKKRFGWLYFPTLTYILYKKWVYIWLFIINFYFLLFSNFRRPTISQQTDE